MKSVVFKDISKQQSEKHKKKTTLTTNESISRLGKSKKKLIMQEIQELDKQSVIGRWINQDPSNPSRPHRLQKRVSLFNLARLFR